jgi:predicted acetyltransferase
VHGDPGDLPALHDLYTAVAQAHDGLLTRRGGAFAPPPSGSWPDGADGLTLVEQDGRTTGALLYERGRGYGPDGRLTAHDLLATTPEAARALAAVLGGWTSVVSTARLPLLDGGAAHAVLPVERARPVRTDAWMHRPVDVVRAIEARGWSARPGRRTWSSTPAGSPSSTAGPAPAAPALRPGSPAERPTRPPSTCWPPDRARPSSTTSRRAG